MSTSRIAGKPKEEAESAQEGKKKVGREVEMTTVATLLHTICPHQMMWATCWNDTAKFNMAKRMSIGDMHECLGCPVWRCLTVLRFAMWIWTQKGIETKIRRFHSVRQFRSAYGISAASQMLAVNLLWQLPGKVLKVTMMQQTAQTTDSSNNKQLKQQTAQTTNGSNTKRLRQQTAQTSCWYSLGADAMLKLLPWSEGLGTTLSSQNIAGMSCHTRIPKWSAQ